MATTTIRVLSVEDNPGDARLSVEALAEAPAVAFHVTSVQTLAETVAQELRSAVHGRTLPGPARSLP